MSGLTRIALVDANGLESPAKLGPNGGVLVEQDLTATAAGGAQNPFYVRGRSSPTGGIDTVAPLTGGGSITGGTLDSSVNSNGGIGTAFFVGEFFSDVAGTCFVEKSADGATWYPCNGSAGTALSAGQTVTIKVPLVGRYYRTRYLNGASAQTSFSIFRNFTLN